MSFMDKFKKGASDVSKKAKDTVEINRLKMQVSNKEKEMNQLFIQIGQQAYELYQEHAAEQMGEGNVSRFTRIDELNEEVHQLKLEIANLNGQKQCSSCKEYVDVNIKFCSTCGNAFDEPTSHEPVEEVAASIETTVPCSNEACQSPVNEDEKFCGECGTAMQSERGE